MAMAPYVCAAEVSDCLLNIARLGLRFQSRGVDDEVVPDGLNGHEDLLGARMAYDCAHA
ncbi:hypothetical protein [Bradyrhizobium sp. CCBAU 11361]|uniref:hypothetical protein n=1 Tax=Bradyrhizobium sp. CCBAU 11361 TaxID=1630812 RepID=UPI0023062B69|nr:hypothetical protein [Bradyrhizobium sp. CCBAU 11361]